MRSSGRLRSVAALILCCFISQNLGWTASVSEAAPPEISLPGLSQQLDIPESLGAVKQIFDAAAQTGKDKISSAPALIHIQDAHGSLEAQQRIAEMLAFLHEKNGLDTVFLEGAAGKMNPEILRFSNRRDLSRKAAQNLLEKGMVGGAEFLLLDRKLEGETPLQAYGIEDQAAYRSNLRDYRKVLNQRERADKQLEELRLSILARSSQSFNQALKDFFKKWLFNEESGNDLLAHLEVLQQAAESRLHIDFKNPWHQIEWPQMVRFAKLKEMEKGASSEKTKAEQEKLIRWIASKGFAKEFAEGLSHLPAAKPSPRFFLEKFYETASSQGFSFKDYPEFSRQAGMAILQSELNAADLTTEISRLDDLLLDAFAKTPEEKEIIALCKNYLLLKKLLHLELTGKEYQAVKAVQEELRRNSGDKALFDTAVHFYEGAKKRDEIFVRNALVKMRDLHKRSAVLITGGFHSEGLEAACRKQNISFAEIMPRISGVINSKAYDEVMSLKGGLPVLKSTILAPRLVAHWDGFDPAEIQYLSGRIASEVREAGIEKNDFSTSAGFRLLDLGAGQNFSDPAARRSEARSKDAVYNLNSLKLNNDYEYEPARFLGRAEVLKWIRERRNQVSMILIGDNLEGKNHGKLQLFDRLDLPVIDDYLQDHYDNQSFRLTPATLTHEGTQTPLLFMSPDPGPVFLNAPIFMALDSGQKILQSADVILDDRYMEIRNPHFKHPNESEIDPNAIAKFKPGTSFDVSYEVDGYMGNEGASEGFLRLRVRVDKKNQLVVAGLVDAEPLEAARAFGQWFKGRSIGDDPALKARPWKEKPLYAAPEFMAFNEGEILDSVILAANGMVSYFGEPQMAKLGEDYRPAERFGRAFEDMPEGGLARVGYEHVQFQPFQEYPEDFYVTVQKMDGKPVVKSVDRRAKGAIRKFWRGMIGHPLDSFNPGFSGLRSEARRETVVSRTSKRFGTGRSEARSTANAVGPGERIGARRSEARATRQEKIEAIKKDFETRREQLKASARAGEFAAFPRLYADLLDETMRKILSAYGLGKKIALLNIGSIGRRAPPYGADYDFLVLVPPGVKPPSTNILESFRLTVEKVFPTMDMPVRIHKWAPTLWTSVPEMEEALKVRPANIAGDKGMTMRWSLLDSRFVAGRSDLFEDFKQKILPYLRKGNDYSGQWLNETSLRHLGSRNYLYSSMEDQLNLPADERFWQEPRSRERGGGEILAEQPPELDLKNGPGSQQLLHLIAFAGRYETQMDFWDWSARSFGELIDELRKRDFFRDFLTFEENSDLKDAYNFYIRLRTAVNLIWEERSKNQNFLREHRNMLTRDMFPRLGEMGFNTDILLLQLQEFHNLVRKTAYGVVSRYHPDPAVRQKRASQIRELSGRPEARSAVSEEDREALEKRLSALESKGVHYFTALRENLASAFVPDPSTGVLRWVEKGDAHYTAFVTVFGRPDQKEDYGSFRDNETQRIALGILGFILHYANNRPRSREEQQELIDAINAYGRKSEKTTPAAPQPVAAQASSAADFSWAWNDEALKRMNDKLQALSKFSKNAPIFRRRLGNLAWALIQAGEAVREIGSRSEQVQWGLDALQLIQISVRYNSAKRLAEWKSLPDPLEGREQLGAQGGTAQELLQAWKSYREKLNALENPVYHLTPTVSVTEWEISRIINHTGGSVYSLAFSPDGKRLAIASADGKIRLQDLEEGTSREFTGHETAVLSIAFSPDGKLLASGGWDRTVRLWDIDKGTENLLHQYQDRVHALAFSPDGKYLAAGGSFHQNDARVWDLDAVRRGAREDGVHGAPRFRELTAPPGTISSLVFSPDGKYLMAGSFQGAVHGWDFEEFLEGNPGPVLIPPHYAFAAPFDGIGSLALSPDSKSLAAVGNAATNPDSAAVIRLWNVSHLERGRNQSSNERLQRPRGTHFRSVTFSPDGTSLASGIMNANVGVWDIAGKNFFQLPGHDDIVRAAVFSPNGKYLASGSDDGTVRLWEVGNLNFNPSGQSRVAKSLPGRSESRAYFKLNQTLDHIINLFKHEPERWIMPTPVSLARGIKGPTQNTYRNHWNEILDNLPRRLWSEGMDASARKRLRRAIGFERDFDNEVASYIIEDLFSQDPNRWQLPSQTKLAVALGLDPHKIFAHWMGILNALEKQTGPESGVEPELRKRIGTAVSFQRDPGEAVAAYLVDLFRQESERVEIPTRRELFNAIGFPVARHSNSKIRTALEKKIGVGGFDADLRKRIQTAIRNWKPAKQKRSEARRQNILKEPEIREEITRLVKVRRAIVAEGINGREEELWRMQLKIQRLMSQLPVPVLAIGDLHGNFKAFKDIRKRADKKDKVIVQAGDFIDRGFFTFQLTDRLREMQTEPDRIIEGSLVRLAGNHELMLLRGVLGQRGELWAWYLNLSDYEKRLIDPDKEYTENEAKALRQRVLEHPQYRRLINQLFLDIKTGDLLAATVVQGRLYTHAGITGALLRQLEIEILFANGYPDPRELSDQQREKLVSKQQIAEYLNVLFRKAFESALLAAHEKQDTYAAFRHWIFTRSGIFLNRSMLITDIGLDPLDSGSHKIFFDEEAAKKIPQAFGHTSHGKIAHEGGGRLIGLDSGMRSQDETETAYLEVTARGVGLAYSRAGSRLWPLDPEIVDKGIRFWWLKKIVDSILLWIVHWFKAEWPLRWLQVTGIARPDLQEGWVDAFLNVEIPFPVFDESKLSGQGPEIRERLEALDTTNLFSPDQLTALAGILQRLIKENSNHSFKMMLSDQRAAGKGFQLISSPGSRINLPPVHFFWSVESQIPGFGPLIYGSENAKMELAYAVYREFRFLNLLNLKLDRQSPEFKDLIDEARKIFRDLGQTFATPGMTEDSANVRLILGSQDVNLFREAAETFSQSDKKIPLIISGGRGRGTPGLEAALSGVEFSALFHLDQALNLKDVSEAQLIAALFQDLGIGPGLQTDIPVTLETASKSTYQNLEFVVKMLRDPDQKIIPAGEKPRIVIYVTEAQAARTVSAMIHRLRTEGLDWDFMVKPAYEVNFENLPDSALLDFLFKVIGVPELFAEDREFLDPDYVKSNRDMDEAARIIRDTNQGGPGRGNTQYPPNTIEPVVDPAYPGGKLEFKEAAVGYAYGPAGIKAVRDGPFAKLLEASAPPRSDSRIENPTPFFPSYEEEVGRQVRAEVRSENLGRAPEEKHKVRSPNFLAQDSKARHELRDIRDIQKLLPAAFQKAGIRSPLRMKILRKAPSIKLIQQDRKADGAYPMIPRQQKIAAALSAELRRWIPYSPDAGVMADALEDRAINLNHAKIILELIKTHHSLRPEILPPVYDEAAGLLRQYIEALFAAGSFSREHAAFIAKAASYIPRSIAFGEEYYPVNGAAYLDYSPVADAFVVLTSDHRLQIRDRKTAQRFYLSDKKVWNINDFKFSPDGKRVGASWPKSFKVYDIEGRRVLKTFHAYGWDVIRDFALAPDGETAAVIICNTRQDHFRAVIWNFKTGKTVREIALETGRQDDFLKIDFTADSARLVLLEKTKVDVRGDNRPGDRFSIWNLSTGEQEISPGDRPTDIQDFVVLPGRIVTAHSRNEPTVIKIWQDSGRFRQALYSFGIRHMPYRIPYLAVSPDQSLLAVSNDGLEVIDLASRREIGSLPPTRSEMFQGAPVESLWFSQDGKALVLRAEQNHVTKDGIVFPLERPRSSAARSELRRMNIDELKEEAKKILKDAKDRPSIFEIQDLVAEGLRKGIVLDAAAELGSNWVPDPAEVKMLFRELETYFPHLQKLVHLIIENRDATFLLAARDTDILFEMLQLLSPDQSRFVRFPGSTAFWINFASEPEERRRAFFDGYGITEQAIRQGKLWVIGDSGFEGTVAFKTKKELVRLYPELAKEIDRQFLPRVVSETDTSYAKPFQVEYDLNGYEKIFSGQDNANFKRLFPRVGSMILMGMLQADWRKFDLLNRFKLLMAVWMQGLPAYYGPYQKLNASLQPRPDSRRQRDIKPDFYNNRDVNPEHVQPTAALLTQLWLVKKFSNVKSHETHGVRSESRTDAGARTLSGEWQSWPSLQDGSIQTAIKTGWADRMQEGVFLYNLDGLKEKQVGKFLAVLNPGRLARDTDIGKPERDLSPVMTAFGSTTDFNQIVSRFPRQNLFRVRLGGEPAFININYAPIVENHFLLIPFPEDNQPQVMTERALNVAAHAAAAENFSPQLTREVQQFVSMLQARNIPHSILVRHRKGNLLLGFNSPGSWASLNHLHFHGLLAAPGSLPFERAKREKAADLGNGISLYDLSGYPVEALVFEEGDLEFYVFPVERAPVHPVVSRLGALDLVGRISATETVFRNATEAQIEEGLSKASLPHVQFDQLLRHYLAVRAEARQARGDLHGTAPSGAGRAEARTEKPAPRYFALYKPASTLSTRNDEHGERPTIYNIFQKETGLDPDSFMALGRLDYDVDGLLIITDDGSMVSLMMPVGHAEKHYLVRVRGKFTEDDARKLREGIDIQTRDMEKREIIYHTKPARVQIASGGDQESLVHLHITEGKYHQVKAMMDAVNHPVIRLTRMGFAGIELIEDLPLKPGQVVELSPDMMPNVLAKLLRARDEALYAFDLAENNERQHLIGHYINTLDFESDNMRTFLSERVLRLARKDTDTLRHIIKSITRNLQQKPERKWHLFPLIEELARMNPDETVFHLALGLQNDRPGAAAAIQDIFYHLVDREIPEVRAKIRELRNRWSKGNEKAVAVDYLQRILLRSEARSEEETLELTLDNVRVLIADDEAGRRGFIKEFLADLGVKEIVEVSTAEDFQKAVRGSRFHVVFLDRQFSLVPGSLRGPEALEALRAEGVQIGKDSKGPVVIYNSDTPDAKTASLVDINPGIKLGESIHFLRGNWKKGFEMAQARFRAEARQKAFTKEEMKEYFRSQGWITSVQDMALHFKITEAEVALLVEIYNLKGIIRNRRSRPKLFVPIVVETKVRAERIRKIAAALEAAGGALSMLELGRKVGLTNSRLSGNEVFFNGADWKQMIADLNHNRSIGKRKILFEILDQRTMNVRRQLIPALEKYYGFASAQQLAEAMAVTYRPEDYGTEGGIDRFTAARHFRKLPMKLINHNRSVQKKFPFFGELPVKSKKENLDRIFAYMEERGGNATVMELAEHFGSSYEAMAARLSHKGTKRYFKHVNRVRKILGLFPLKVVLFYEAKQSEKKGTRVGKRKQFRPTQDATRIFGEGEDSIPVSSLYLVNRHYRERLGNRGFRSFLYFTAKRLYEVLRPQWSGKSLDKRAVYYRLFEQALILLIDRAPAQKIITLGKRKSKEPLLQEYFRVFAPRAINTALMNLSQTGLDETDAVRKLSVQLSRVQNEDYPLVPTIYHHGETPASNAKISDARAEARSAAASWEGLHDWEELWMTRISTLEEELKEVRETVKFRERLQQFEASLRAEAETLKAGEGWNPAHTTQLDDTVTSLLEIVEDQTRQALETLQAGEAREEAARLAEDARLQEAFRALETLLGRTWLSFRSPQDFERSKAAVNYRSDVEGSKLPAPRRAEKLKELDRLLRRFAQQVWDAANEKTMTRLQRDPSWRWISEKISEAKTAYGANDFEKAFGIYENLLSDLLEQNIEPSVRSRVILGASTALRRLQRYEEALDYTRNGLEMDPFNFNLNAEIGWTHFHWGLKQRMAHDFEKARGNFEETLKQADLILERKPDMWAAINMRIGSMVELKQDPDEIERWMARAEEGDSRVGFGNEFPRQLQRYHQRLRLLRQERHEVREISYPASYKRAGLAAIFAVLELTGTMSYADMPHAAALLEQLHIPAPLSFAETQAIAAAFLVDLKYYLQALDLQASGKPYVLVTDITEATPEFGQELGSAVHLVVTDKIPGNERLKERNWNALRARFEASQISRVEKTIEETLSGIPLYRSAGAVGAFPERMEIETASGLKVRLRFQNEEVRRAGFNVDLSRYAAPLIQILGEATKEQVPDLLARFGLREENGEVAVGLNFMRALASIYSKHQAQLLQASSA